MLNLFVSFSSKDLQSDNSDKDTNATVVVTIDQANTSNI